MNLVSLSNLFTDVRSANHPVAISYGEIVTWQSFVTSVEVLQQNIAASPSQRWLLSCGDALEFLVALFAVWQAGRTPIVPVNFQSERVSNDSSLADEVISGVRLRHDGLPGTELKSLDLHSSRLILHTSGSTGVPKSIEKTLFQLDAEVSALEHQWGNCLKNARVIATVPHYHIYGLLFRLLWPIASGRAFVVEELSMPDDIQSGITRYAPVALISSPSHLERIPSLIDLNRIAPYVYKIYSSGSPLSPQTAQVFADATGSAPTEVLGSTETGGIAWREGGETWTAFADVGVRLAKDDALEVCSPRTCEQGWHVTGDRAEVVGDLGFRLTGRLDRVAKIEGKRVSLEDIEKRLNAHVWIVRSGVVKLDGARTVLGVVAEISANGQSHLDEMGRNSLIAGLKAYLSQWFEPVVIPKQWRFVSALPTDDRGKTTASRLAALFATAQ